MATALAMAAESELIESASDTAGQALAGPEEEDHDLDHDQLHERGQHEGQERATATATATAASESASETGSAAETEASATPEPVGVEPEPLPAAEPVPLPVPQPEPVPFVAPALRRKCEEIYNRDARYLWGPDEDSLTESELRDEELYPMPREDGQSERVFPEYTREMFHCKICFEDECLPNACCLPCGLTHPPDDAFGAPCLIK